MTELIFLTEHAEIVLFLAILAEQLGAPIPSVPILVAAGALAAEGALNPASAITLTLVACTIADVIWFYIGRRGGTGLLRWLGRLPGCEASWVARSERFFAKYGMAAVAAAKFVPGLGFLMPPIAGAFGIRFSKFLKFDGLGSVVYGIFYLELGFLFGREVKAILEWISHFSVIVVVLGMALLTIWIGRKQVQRRKATSTSELRSTALATLERS